MAFLNYEYKMKIKYSKPVDKCYFTIKSIPADDFRQRNISYEISINPYVQYSEGVDSFGNIQIIGQDFKKLELARNRRAIRNLNLSSRVLSKPIR